MKISTWGCVYDGGETLTIYPNGEDHVWNSRTVAVPFEDRHALYADLLRLSGDRYAETPTLDRLIHPPAGAGREG